MFAWNVAFVTSGAVISQVLIMAAMPIMTRIYKPDEMGTYALFVALIGVVSVISSLHYELAIPLPSSDQKAFEILRLSLAVGLIFSFIFGLLIYVFQGFILKLLNAEKIANHLLAVPICILLTSYNQILNFWAIRKRQFKSIAIFKCTFAGSQVFAQIFLGFKGLGVLGLIVGQIVGLVSASLIILINLRIISILKEKCKISVLFENAKLYKDFSIYTVLSSLINAVSVHLPILLLMSKFDPISAGLFALSFRVLQAPMNLLGSSIAQVFFSQASDDNREGKLSKKALPIYYFLVSFSLPTFLLTAFVAPDLFGLVFGEEWRDSGLYARYIMPWLLFSFIVNPLSVLVSVLNAQRQELYFQIVYLIFILIAFWIGVVKMSVTVFLIYLGFLGGIIMVLKMFWLLKISGISLKIAVWYLLKDLFRLSPYIIILFIINKIFEAAFIYLSTAALFFVIIHFYNYRYRKIYNLVFS
jgi:O-antigen/teichoic acid export membrane protein